MNRKQINLGQWVVDFESLHDVSTLKSDKDFPHIRKEVDNLMGVLQSKLPLFFQSPSGVNSDRKVFAVVLAFRECFHILEVSNGPSQEIGAHEWCAFERNDLEAFLSSGLLGHRHVAQSNEVGWNLKAYVERCFQIRLIEAGKSSASVTRLELCAEHAVELLVLGHRLRRICF